MVSINLFSQNSYFLENVRELMIFHKSHGKVTGWGGIKITTIIGLVDRGG